jgi:XTP/dITP diphosphohydrolase
MRIVFATNNLHKIKELQNAFQTLLPGEYELVGLRDIGIYEELPETMDTLEGNATQKARFIYNRHPTLCFADDTGLEVFALNNRPGVYSARYAGIGCSYDENINKLLKEMEGINVRYARFRTVIALILRGKTFLFNGVIDGMITDSRRGNNGFGYDPVFQPDGYYETFAEMSLDSKNLISHRANAVKKLVEFLSDQNRLEKL